MRLSLLDRSRTRAGTPDAEAIAEAVRESVVCSLARANDRDIARAAEALRGAARSRIHTDNAVPIPRPR